MTATILIAALLPAVLLFGKARFSRISMFVDLLSTFWHEMAHAVTASALYGEVDSVRLVPGKRVKTIQGTNTYTHVYSSSGVTNYFTDGSSLRIFLITGAGYAGPTLLSLAMAASWYVFGLNVFAVIWTVVLLVMMLLASRGIYAWLINVASLLMVSFPLWPLEETTLTKHLAAALPTLLISSLLIYGLKDSLSIFKSMRAIERGEVPATGDSDTEKLGSMTGIAPSLWAALYVILSFVGIVAVPSLLIWQN